MMNKWPLIAFLLLVLACGSQDQLNISEEKLITLMVDIHLAEAAMQRLTTKVKDTVSTRYYNEIFEIHQMKEDQYLENLLVLERNPKLAKKIYDETLSRITTMENEH